MLYRPTSPIPQPRIDTIAVVRVELIGANTAVAREFGITVCGETPVIDLCRTMVDAGHDPRTRLAVYRGGTLVLTVRSIGEAAVLEINTRGTFVLRHERRRAPPVRQNGSGHTEVAGRSTTHPEGPASEQFQISVTRKEKTQ